MYFLFRPLPVETEEGDKDEQLAVDFSENNCNDWHCAYNYMSVKIRRLSTKSSVLVDDERSCVGLTEWKWYWEENNVWKEYEKSVSEILIYIKGKPKGLKIE